ncbi:MAG TPA: DUF5317 family protein [Acidimicrobiia bacterium]|nr:DUF5317 family protein [Acidimicrobiia bacterium]
MSFLGLVVLVAAIVPLVTGGSYRRLADAPWRGGGLLALGLGLQLLLDTGLVPKSAWHSVGFGILVASYVVLVGFCGGNMLVRGMAVVLIGVALNGFVITIDQGMPVKIPPDWQTSSPVGATVKHHPRAAGDHLLALTDVIVLRKLDAVISFGDLIIAFGLIDVTYWASRRTRRARTGTPLAEKHADATPVVREVLELPALPTPTPTPTPTSPTPTPAPAPARRPDRTRPPRPVRVRQPARVPAESAAPPEPESEPATRSGAGGSMSAIKEALERLERP